MKYLFLILSISILSSCAKKTEHHDHNQSADEATSENPNEALYNEVMDIHDEVMPKIEDIYKLKKELQDKIASNPGLTEEETKQLEQRIARLDSANDMMMEWMHKFNPLPDSADKEEAREYLESEMERIKKVKEVMLEAIEKEKGAK